MKVKVLILYSGGKDSQASLIWAVKKYGVENCEAVFCDTGWENPVTYQHIEETTQQLGVKLITLKSAKYDGFIDLAKKKGRFPSTRARFCTMELKAFPVIDYVLTQDCSLVVVEGIRKDESVSRSKMGEECMYFKYYFQPRDNGKKDSYRRKEILEWCKKYDASKFRPVFNWTAEEVISYIKDNGQHPNWLYYQGFSRVGCYPCIMAKKSEVKLIIDNDHDRWQYIKNMENYVGSSLFGTEYIPEHSRTGMCAAGSYSTAEDIERYLKRKNATLDMFEKDNTPGCMSVYGLCE